MAETTYKYYILTDFPNAAVDPARLKQEIQSSSITIALDGISTALDGYCNIVFKTAINEEKGVLDSLVGAHSGDPLTPELETVKLDVKQTNDSKLRVAIEKSDSFRKTFFTHNWCDRTTWYPESVRVDNETPTSDGYYTTYSLANQYIIDMYHGKVTHEDRLLDSDGYSYRVAVTVDGYVKAEQDPHYGTGGDFVVDYEAGTITFSSALTAQSDVRVTYHYATSSNFSIKPSPGKSLLIDRVEVQFSKDVQLNDTSQYIFSGYAAAFAPQYVPPLSPTSLVEISTLNYKTFQDYLNDCTGSYPNYSAMGGSGWRGTQTESVILVWDYISATTLFSSAGMQVDIKLEHETPFGGSWSAVTFYCIEEDEVV